MHSNDDNNYLELVWVHITDYVTLLHLKSNESRGLHIGFRVYISGRPLVPMLQALNITWIN